MVAGGLWRRAGRTALLGGDVELEDLEARPAHDGAHLAAFGTGNEGVATAYQPQGFDEIPDGLKDPDGRWFTVHSGALGMFVNVDALGDAPVPACWADLLKPEYEGPK